MFMTNTIEKNEMHILCSTYIFLSIIVSEIINGDFYAMSSHNSRTERTHKNYFSLHTFPKLAVSAGCTSVYCSPNNTACFNSV
jgi:hypothetical protein